MRFPFLFFFSFFLGLNVHSDFLILETTAHPTENGEQ